MPPIHFLHIRKTGGNALKAALRPVAEEYGLVLHEHATTLSDVGAGERVAFVIRDPVARFVSGFNSRLRKGQPLRNAKWSDGEAEAFARFKTPNDLAKALTDTELCDQARKAMSEIAHVRTSFADVLGSREHILERLPDIVWIGRTESLEGDFEKLKQRLGLPSAIALPADAIAAHRTPPGFSTELCEIGRKNIAEWYAEDREFVAWLESYR